MNLAPLFPILESAFDWVTKTSVSATVLIALCLCLLFALPKVFGPRWRFALGALVLLRLVMPVSPEGRMSFLNLVKRTPETAKAQFVAPTNESLVRVPTPAAAPKPLLHIEASPVPSTSPVFLPDPTPPIRARQQSFLRLPVFALLWIIGTGGLIGLVAARSFRFSRWIRRHAASCDCPRLQELLDRCRRQLGLHRSPPLVSAPRLSSAAVLGWRNPRLLISEDFGERFSDSQIRGIFLHELAHIRRHDVLWNWLSHLALTLHWFNPLVWIAVRRFRADREQICDAIALRHLSPGQQTSYGKTLLAALHHVSKSAPPLAPTPTLAPFFNRKSEIRNRIAMMTRKNPPTHWTLHGLAALALAAAAAFTFTSATADDEKPDRDREKPREESKERERAQERPHGEAAEKRGRPEAAARETRRDADRPKPEARETRREGDRGRDHPEAREGRRDGECEKPEARATRRAPERDGDRPPEVHPEREARAIAEKMEVMVKEIGNLTRAGRNDDAHAIELKLQQLHRQHPEIAKRLAAHHREREQGGIQQKMRELEGALKKAMEAGKEEIADKIREHMEDLQRSVHHRAEAEHAERRIHHLHEAAENLEAAGFPDQAHGLRKQAEEFEREMHRRHEEGRDQDRDRHAENLEREVDELREVVGEMRKHIKRLEEELRRARGERD